MRKRTRVFIGLILVCTFLYFIILQRNPVIERYYRYISVPVDFSTLGDMEDSVDDEWLCVEQSACIYSAYWDDRYSPPYIRLIVIVPKTANVNSWNCLLKYNDTAHVVAPLKMQAIPEGHGKGHVAAFLLCRADNRPEKVKILSTRFNSSFIVVKRTDLVESGKGKLAVCVRPFYWSFNNNNSIIAEFIAYYQELGADHFSFYDYESDFTLKKLLNGLMGNGFPIDVLPWNLPEKFSDAWAYGQMAFSADCLYRNSHEYEYVATLDVDEFIVPKEDISLKDVIEKVSQKSKFGTYVFRQTFFCMEYENDPNSVNLTIPLVTQTKTRHETKIWPYYDRSKCIVRPVAVVAPGIHYTWVHFKSWKSHLVSNSVALLHHYRAQKCRITKGNAGVLERIMLRYRERILNSSVIKIWKMLFL